MGPGDSFFHGAPSANVNAANPEFQFRPDQFEAIRKKCKSLHPTSG
jgi:hypothetical protein